MLGKELERAGGIAISLGLPSGSALGQDAIAARNPTTAHDAMYLHLVYNRQIIDKEIGTEQG